MATRTISTKITIDGEGEYRAAIKRINAEMAALKSEMKLSKTQFEGNANSMDALRSKGETLNKMLQVQQSRIDALKKVLGDAKNASDQLASKKAELEQRLQDNAAAQENLKNKTGDTSKEEARLKAESEQLHAEMAQIETKMEAVAAKTQRYQAAMNDANAEEIRLNREIEQNKQHLDEAKNSADGCATSIDKFGNAVGESAEKTQQQNAALDALAATMVASSLKKAAEDIVKALKSCVDASMDFEYAMSGVRAVSGATSEEMAALTAKAKEIGATTMFTAGQTAEAMQYMALAGWSAEEMLDSIGGVMDLAAASGEDLGQVCDIVTDALTAFGMSASDTGRFVDVLAASAANSNTTVGMLGEAFKYVAPVAGRMGYSIEDVAVAMGLMANNGIKGSMAGTTLRNMLQTLSGEVVMTGEAFGELKIRTQNADGSMRPLSAVLDDLRDAFGQMTDAEKAANAETLATTRGMAGMMALLGTTADDFNSLSEAIQNSTGAAQRMAAVRMDNLRGQVTLMQSAFDALKIEVGDQLNPAMQGLVGTGTEVLTWATDFISRHKEIVPLIGAVATAMGVLTTAVIGYNAVIKIAKPLLETFNMLLKDNHFVLYALAITTAIAAITAFVSLLENAKQEVAEMSREMASEAYGFTGALEDQNKALEDNLYAIDATADRAGRYVERLRELEQAGELTAEQQSEWGATLRNLVQMMPELGDQIDLTTGKLANGAEGLAVNVEKLRTAAKARAYENYLSELYEEQYRIEAELGVNRRREADKEKTASDTKGQYGDFLTNTGVRFGKEAAEARETEERLRQENQAAQIEYQAAQEAVKAGETALTDVAESIGYAEEAYKNLTGTTYAYTQGLIDVTDMEEVRRAQTEAVCQDIDELVARYQEAHDAALKSIQGQIGLFDEFEAKVDGSTDSAEKMMDIWAREAENINAYSENIAKAAAYGLDEKLVNSFSEFSAENAGYLQTVIGEIEQLGVGSREAAEFVERFNQAFQQRGDAMESYSQTVGLMESGFTEAVAAMQAAADAADFSGFAEALSSAFADVGVDLETLGLTAGGALASGLDGSKRAVQTATDGLVGILEQGGADAVTDFDAEFRKISETTDTRLTELRETISTGFGTMPGDMTDIGAALVDGLIAGIDSRAGSLYAKIQSVVNAAVEAARAAADSHSPSRKTMKLGKDMGEGVALGWERKRERVAEAGRGVIEEALRQQTEVALKVQLARETIDPRMPELPKTAGGEPGSPREKSGGIVEHRHSGTVRIEGVDGEGRFAGAAEVVYEDLVARLQVESRW